MGLQFCGCLSGQIVHKLIGRILKGIDEIKREHCVMMMMMMMMMMKDELTLAWR